MRLLTALGCRNRRDLAACIACYAIGHMAAYFLAFCCGVAFALIVGAVA